MWRLLLLPYAAGAATMGIVFVRMRPTHADGRWLVVATVYVALWPLWALGELAVYVRERL